MPIDEFSRKAWERNRQANAHPPRRCLDIVSAQIDDLEIEPDHIVVIVHHTAIDGETFTEVYNSGRLPPIAVHGMCSKATIITGS